MLIARRKAYKIQSSEVQVTEQPVLRNEAKESKWENFPRSWEPTDDLLVWKKQRSEQDYSPKNNQWTFPKCRSQDPRLVNSSMSRDAFTGGCAPSSTASNQQWGSKWSGCRLSAVAMEGSAHAVVRSLRYALFGSADIILPPSFIVNGSQTCVSCVSSYVCVFILYMPNTNQEWARLCVASVRYCV